MKLRVAGGLVLIPIILYALAFISYSACSGDEGERCRIVCPVGTNCIIGTWEDQDISGPQHWCEKEDGTKHGKYVAWLENGQMWEAGNYCDGLACATWTFWNENGSKESEGNYCDGKLCGMWTSWHDNGQKHCEGEYCDDARCGYWTCWHSNGTKSSEGEASQGKSCGPWTYWDEDGSLIVELEEENSFPCDLTCPWECPEGTSCFLGELMSPDYSLGPALWCEKPDNVTYGPYAGYVFTAQKVIQGEHCDWDRCGIWTTWYFMTNQKMDEGEYCNDMKCGNWVVWHTNGHKAAEGEYRNDEKCGTWTHWDESGNLSREEVYDPCS